MNLYWRGTRAAGPGPAAAPLNPTAGRGHSRRDDPAKSRTRRWSNLTRLTCDSEGLTRFTHQSSKALWHGRANSVAVARRGTVAGRLGGACQSRRSQRSAASETRVCRRARLRPGCLTAEPRTPMERWRSCWRRPRGWLFLARCDLD